ncbi:hypothetical protein P2G88_07615 [Aliiglaciecola sp. CAU 1673]|uniref:hypothetical protein n=1 Tax=Aliiglaciecola sp. CAU 1673 TaxID=3032595 RepID=UPI0023DB4B62|nr:hypothetical protein [Aliiglaciecola sp. CAU 1673]MDF2178118.1 hypothetical protein [Aliiglaciecola sp. CAU 1673]
MKPYLLVIKSRHLEDVRHFYAQLGMLLEAGQQEGHPPHYSTKLHGLVLEFHACISGESPSNIRLGFELDSNRHDYAHIVQHIQEISENIQFFGEDMAYTVLQDPDGRDIELVYSREQISA